jgi:hypothetical protein
MIVLFCVMCVVCELCLIVVPLPPGENPFEVKINIYLSMTLAPPQTVPSVLPVLNYAPIHDDERRYSSTHS